MFIRTLPLLVCIVLSACESNVETKVDTSHYTEWQKAQLDSCYHQEALHADNGWSRAERQEDLDACVEYWGGCQPGSGCE